MKKVLSTLLLAGMFAFYACGPSAEEKANAEKQVQDSIAAAAAATAAAATATPDSAAAATADTSKMATPEKK